MNAKQFKKIREELGLSQQAMGRLLGHQDGRQVRYYENGDRPVPPTIRILMSIYQLQPRLVTTVLRWLEQ